MGTCKPVGDRVIRYEIAYVVNYMKEEIAAEGLVRNLPVLSRIERLQYRETPLFALAFAAHYLLTYCR